MVFTTYEDFRKALRTEEELDDSYDRKTMERNRRRLFDKNYAMPDRLTWEMLVEEEPALEDLRRKIGNMREGRDLSEAERNKLWYHGEGTISYKRRMGLLVGHCAVRGDLEPFMYSSWAYDIAYQKLSGLLFG